MFTGIIEERGEITAVEPSGDGVRVTVRGPRASTHGSPAMRRGGSPGMTATDGSSPESGSRDGRFRCTGPATPGRACSPARAPIAAATARSARPDQSPSPGTGASS